MTDELISVIVPVYNVESYLNECVASLINQTYKNIEILLIDDGSEDESGKICDYYSKIDDRVKVFHKENGGLSDARNFGIEKSKGKIIAFVDSDDYVSTKMYEILYKKMKESNCEIVECGCVKFDDGSKPNEFISYETKILKSKEWIMETNLGEFLSCVSWNKLYKKNLFNQVEYPVGKHFEDEATTYKLVYKTDRICRVNSKLYFYRQRGGSISNSSFRIEDVKDKFYALNTKVHFFKDRNEKEMFEFASAKLAIYMISEYGEIKKYTCNSKEYYRYIKKLFKEIYLSKAIPVKYKLYIMLYLIIPILFGKRV